MGEEEMMMMKEGKSNSCLGFLEKHQGRDTKRWPGQSARSKVSQFHVGREILTSSKQSLFPDYSHWKYNLQTRVNHSFTISSWVTNKLFSVFLLHIENTRLLLIVLVTDFNRFTPHDFIFTVVTICSNCSISLHIQTLEIQFLSSKNPAMYHWKDIVIQQTPHCKANKWDIVVQMTSLFIVSVYFI